MENLKTFEEFNENDDMNSLNEANKDFRPESVRTREKITNLYTKSNDAVTKARELDNEGDMLKSRIQFLTSESLRLKARAAELDWRIKQLKEKL
jgi:chromosome segregation ATPase